MKTIFIHKRYLLSNILLCLCFSIMAQTDYYYKGKKIPLTVNKDKVCVNVPKVGGKTSERIRANVKVLEQIKDETFDIFIVSHSDYEKLTFLDSWGKDAESVLLTPSYKTSNNAEVFLTPYLNLRLKKEEDIDILRSYAQDLGLEIIRQDPLMPLWYILSITSETGKNALEIANALWESGKFAASVPDLCSNDLLCSNDPYFNLQWGLHNENYSGIDISATSAWAYATGKNVKIAFIDSGVDLNQIDLAPNISSLSYDTETGTSPSVVYEAHATHCAGIAAAVKDNGIQVAGV